MVVTTADHLIRAADQFRQNVEVAIDVAREPDVLVTFGIKPSVPATTYGYVHRGGLCCEQPGLCASESVRVYQVKEFREKPPRDVAQQYLDSGQFYWNSGMFVWRAQTILDSLHRSTPELYAALSSLEPLLGGPDQDTGIADAYAGLDKVSIDYAVMEKAAHVRVVEATFDWDDLGSWLALERHHPQDAAGNTVLAEHHAGMDTRGCVLSAEPGHLLATIGVDDLVVVHTADATLVCAKERVNDIKAIVRNLEQGGEALGRYL